VYVRPGSANGSNIPIGQTLYHLTDTIERLISTARVLNGSIDYFHKDIGTLTSGIGGIHSDINSFKNDFNNLNITAAHGISQNQ